MAIIVEDGSIVENANSYVSEAELQAYATARGIVLAGDPEQLLIQAMDYIESQSFAGQKKTQDQPLQWPRRYVYIDGYLFPSDEIPKELKQALMATAVAVDEGNSPLNPVTPSIKRERVDVLEVEYTNGTSGTIYTSISYSLRKLLGGGSYGLNQIRVGKA